MNLEETIRFMKDIRIGAHVNMEYLSFFGKNKSIEGLVYSINPWYVSLAKPNTNVFCASPWFGYKSIALNKLIKYRTIQQKE